MPAQKPTPGCPATGFDRDIRQWSPDWVQYDEYYRPIILNPYHERVRIVYIYDNRPRIVWIPPLGADVLDVAQFAAYSFTAVVELRPTSSTPW